MDGRVVLINPQGQKVAVCGRRGEYSVFAVNRGPMPEVGDLVSGSFHALGSSKLVNLTQKRLLRVDILRAGDPVAARTKQWVMND